jgi:hypothetical protein
VNRSFLSQPFKGVAALQQKFPILFRRYGDSFLAIMEYVDIA